MRMVLQRVQKARVEVSENTIAQIGAGLLLLVGITHDDTETDAKYLAEKCVNLRIFEDDAGKMNLSGLEVGAELLAISQFTLYADTRRGRRPSFVAAAPPEESLPMFNKFVELLKSLGLKVMTGEFGARMKVDFINDGPVTIILDSHFR
ncbi:MAG: D-aminoacyl-tRNA deacylase [bacterium]